MYIKLKNMVYSYGATVKKLTCRVIINAINISKQIKIKETICVETGLDQNRYEVKERHK